MRYVPDVGNSLLRMYSARRGQPAIEDVYYSFLVGLIRGIMVLSPTEARGKLKNEIHPVEPKT